ncbi:Cobalt-zinc-cadmium resistance protein CzcA; Cation efflux system protein CusA [hydrothermal vent metagenome]|uniref:Cobalt-zinc-cadmium resistance protein CzcA Cation efflux system protein CusA n=1 Tax=hydrothermal vent metagenome TaxID=652676 RepID=A0A3B1DIK7_9ZZZZ
MPNIWWMPIQTRNEMLATGIRSTLAIKMEGLLKQYSGARSIFAERVTGGYYINFKPIARSMIVLFSVPFALIGGIWVLKYLDYNMSVAVWVGLIALAGGGQKWPPESSFVD